MRVIRVALMASVGYLATPPVQAKTVPTSKRSRPVIRATFRMPTTQGRLAARPAGRVIHDQRKMLLLCYERVLHLRPGIGGTATLTLEVDESGSVRNASARGFDPDVDSCLSGVARKWRFAAPARGNATITQIIDLASP